MPLFPPAASTNATQVDALFLFLVVVALGVTTLIAGLIVFFMIKYRRRAEDELPPQITGSLKLEFAWTIIPFGFFMLIFFWGAGIYLNTAQPPNNAMPVYVVAKQWMWKFQHSGGQSEIDELHVPVGRPVKLIMTSQDVIHSFFVPDFRIKQDVLPDRYTTIWFQATQSGEYRIFCAQYCGTSHAQMLGTVIVMEPAVFQQWLSGGTTTALSPVEAGQKLFAQLGCSSCHKLDGTGVAPSFAGRFGKSVQTTDGRTLTVDENYLRTCILYPDRQRTAGYQPLMPSFFGRIDESQLLNLIDYIKSLSTQPTPGRTATP